MFSGIVSALGTVASAASSGDGVRLRIEAPALGVDDVAIGDSIAVQGVCLTVVALGAAGFEAEVSRATLVVTRGLAAGNAVNLEKALRASDRLGGHIVSGHVDAVGRVTAFEELGGSARLEIEMPASIARFVARKGSICVDGVSLTVNEVSERRFEVNLIPQTRAVTTLGSLKTGAEVNLEVDMIARYVERLVSAAG
jgi:riboflavin synthase